MSIKESAYYKAYKKVCLGSHMMSGEDYANLKENLVNYQPVQH